MTFGKQKLKFYRYIKYFLCVLLLFLGLVAAGCGKEKEVDKKDDPVITGTVTPQATPETTPEATPTPTEKPKNPNPFQINGYQSGENREAFDENGNVQLLAGIGAEPKIGEEYIFDLSVLSYNETYVLAEYIAAKSQQDYFMAENCKHHLVLLSTDTLEVVKEVVLDGYFFINTNKNAISYQITDDSGWAVVTYDYELNPIAELKAPGDLFGYVTSDGKRCYYVADKKIYALNGENKVEREVAGNANYLADYVSGVITDEAGNDFVIFSGMAADYKTYQFILNVNTGEVIRVFQMENGYSEVTKNTYTECYLGDYYPSHWLFGVSQDKAYDFEWKGTRADISPYTLNNGDKLFKYAQNDTMYLFLYDFSTGKLKGSVSFDVAELEKKGDSEGPEDASSVQVYITDDPVYMDENTILLSLSNLGNEKFFVKWNLALDEADANYMAVTEHKMGTLSSVDISAMNNPLYTPGELSEELKPLRGKADQLEEEYGVEIYIGEECSNILGGYTVAPLTEYYRVEDSLKMLEEEMEKYPDNFFEQFEYSWVEGLEIYLAGTLKGIDGDVLDYAGGFKTVYDSKIVLVMDCNDFGVESIFHHELCHAIEEKIVDASYSQENPLFNEDVWNSLNPFDDMYTYTYGEYGYSKYQEYTYEQGLYDGDVQFTYFVDGYAMTYPTEDRARLFESIMTDELYQIDFLESPYLMEKINYYAECIREVFDTTGWNDVPWEAYLVYEE